MAIDSAIKRASVINFGVPWYANLSVPSSGVGNDDQSFMLNMYAGIAFQTETTSAGAASSAGLAVAIGIMSGGN